MTGAFDPQSAYLLVGSATVFALAAIAGGGLHHRRVPGGWPCAALAAAAAGWTLAALMTGLSAPAAAESWLRTRYVFAMLSPATVAWFLLEASGRMPARRHATIAALFAVPVAASVATWIEPPGAGWVIASVTFVREGAITHLGSLSRGPVWWLAIGFGYALTIANLVLAVTWATRAGPAARGPALAAVIGIVAPAIGNAAFHLRMLPSWLDPMPIAFAVTAAAIVHAIVRHRMLDLVPVARSRVVDALDDGVLATDATGRVVDLNASMAAILALPARDAIGRPAGPLLATLGDLAAKLPTAGLPTGPDGTFATIRGRHYGVRLVPLPEGPSGAGGRLLLLHDLTARVVMEHERDRLIEALREALGQVRTLRGLLPLCASCKNVRDGAGRWRPVDAYIRDHSLATVSHGICPDCAPRPLPAGYRAAPHDD